MDRTQKQNAVGELKDIFTSASTVVVTHYRGMTVGEISELRNKARENGTKIKVTKNTLAKIASNDTDFSDLTDFFEGPTAIAYSDDAVAAAKTVVDFAKDNEKLVIIGGAFDGTKMDDGAIARLALTPALDTSRGKIVGLLTAAAGNIARVVQTPGGNIARVLSAHSEQGE